MQHFPPQGRTDERTLCLDGVDGPAQGAPEEQLQLLRLAHGRLVAPLRHLRPLAAPVRPTAHLTQETPRASRRGPQATSHLHLKESRKQRKGSVGLLSRPESL